MMTLKTILMVTALCASSSAFAADAPEYLLGDVGVRLDLPGSWNMTRWSDWDFKAETPDKSVMLFAWATPIQVPVAGDAAAWAKIFEAKVTELGGKDPKVVASTIETIGGRPAALLDVEFAFGAGGASGTLYGATIEVAGQNLHIAAVGSKANAKKAQTHRATIVERLDVKPEGAPLKAETTKVAAAGVETTLPDGWRPPFEREVEHVAKLASQLGIADPAGCATGIRPRAGGDPDVMVTCKAGLHVGVLDALTFGDVEPTVRGKIFGKAEVPAAAPLALTDRTGMLYTPDMGAQGIAVSVVPYDQGVALTWVLGQRGDATLGESAKAAALASTYSGLHQVETGELVSYYLSYQPTHPYVLVPVGGLALGAVGLAGVVGLVVSRSRKRKPEDEA